MLDNAAKYTEPGGRIELSLEGDATHAVVRVGDTATPIDPEFLPHIFELFAQGAQTVNRSHGGLGIGLTVVKKIVEMHGGSIDVDSKQDRLGNEFVVRLPRVGGQRELALQGESGTPSSHSMHLRVLLVEDNQDAAESFAVLLRMRGYDVRLAFDGKDGLQTAETLKPDVIVLDIGLPDMSGYDVCRTIRKQTLGDQMRIVALTGWGQEDDRRQSTEAGFDAHLVKPVEEQALVSLIRESLKKLSSDVGVVRCAGYRVRGG